MGAHDFALLVGNSDYNGKLPTLAGPPNDIAAFAEWLTDSEGGDVPAGNILVLADIVGPLPAGVQAPTPALFHVVYNRFFETDMLAQAATGAGQAPRRRLWVLFAGHGNMPARQFGVVPITACFIPQDWTRRPQSIGWIVPVEYVRLWVDAFDEFDEVVIFMDCCRSETSDLVQAVNLMGAGRAGAAPRARQFVTVCAAQSDRLAYERPIGENDAVHGVFTTAVLNGLRTVRDPQRRLTVKMLLDYIKSAYGDYFADRRIKPEPELLDAPAIGGFLLLTGNAMMPMATFVASQAAIGTFIQIADGGDNIVEGFALTDPPVPIPLKIGLYRVLSAAGDELQRFKHSAAEGTTVNV